MPTGTFNIILDIILIVASIWMVFTVRGLGGLVGRSLTLIVIGAVILGVAHLIATLTGRFLPWDSTFNGFVHRLVVLAGFVLLTLGFMRIRELKV